MAASIAEKASAVTRKNKKVAKPSVQVAPVKPRTRRSADPFAKALAALPDKWVACRDMRHAWDVLNNFHLVPDFQVPGGKKINVFHRDLLCSRCGTVRREDYQALSTGALDKVNQDYVYPEGYQMRGVPRGANASAVIQFEQYRRAMAQVANAEPGDNERSD